MKERTESKTETKKRSNRTRWDHHVKHRLRLRRKITKEEQKNRKSAGGKKKTRENTTREKGRQ